MRLHKQLGGVNYGLRCLKMIVYLRHKLSQIESSLEGKEEMRRLARIALQKSEYYDTSIPEGYDYEAI